MQTALSAIRMPALQSTQIEVCATSPKQRSLRRRAAEGAWARVALADDAMLVEAESPGIKLEQFFLRAPVLAFAAHALAKDTRVQFAATRIANAIQNAIGFSRKFLAQTFFKIRRNAAGQAQHVDECAIGAAVLRALEKFGNVARQAGHSRSN